MLSTGEKLLSLTLFGSEVSNYLNPNQGGRKTSNPTGWNVFLEKRKGLQNQIM